uniref:REJ domain-containing protein n=1 Tax=Ascaris lumbricoides TaxID=6252 RepID=A0A0M3I7X8_ASCLU
MSNSFDPSAGATSILASSSTISSLTLSMSSGIEFSSHSLLSSLRPIFCSLFNSSSEIAFSSVSILHFLTVSITLCDAWSISL